MSVRSAAAQKAWETRRKRANEVSERQRKAAHKAWATRRARQAEGKPMDALPNAPKQADAKALVNMLADAVVAKLKAEGLVVAASK